MKDNFWTSTTTDNLTNWFYSNDTTEKNTIYSNELYPVLDTLVDKVVNKLNINETIITPEDLKQDLHIHIWDKLMNRLKPELLQAAQQFFYVGCFNYTYTLYIAKKRLNTLSYDSYVIDEDNDNSIISNVTATSEFNTDYYVDQKDNQINILKAIDDKISNNKVYTTNTMYLEYLKRYIIDNDYECEGFDQWVIKQMNISKENFALINSKLHISTKPLRTHKIK